MKRLTKALLTMTAILTFGAGSLAAEGTFTQEQLNGPCGDLYQGLQTHLQRLDEIENGADPIRMNPPSNALERDFVEKDCSGILWDRSRTRPHSRVVEHCQLTWDVIVNQHERSKPARIQSERVIITEANRRLAVCEIMEREVIRSEEAEESGSVAP